MKKKFGIFAGFILLFFLVIIILYYRNISTRNEVEKLVSEKRLINILVAGSNVYNKNMHRFFALMTINPVNYNIGVTFIPPSYKIIDDESEKGFTSIDRIDFSDFKKIRNTLKNDLKMNVPFYVELYSPDAKRIVDLIEGIDLYIYDQFKDNQHIPMGLNYFDGRKIIKYINNAAENSIFIKYDRIQDILISLYYNKDKKKNFCNIKVITEMVKTVKTSLLPREILTAGEIIYKKGNLITAILPGVLKDNLYSVDDISYKIYEEDFLSPLIVGKSSDTAIKIKILNGTGMPGLARKMRNDLIKEGLNVVEFGSAGNKEYAESIIITRKGNIYSWDKLIKLTGIKNIYPIIDNSPLHNVLIIIGKDMIR